MDLVVNHTSDEHPWFVASRSSRDDPKRDWYWWRPPRPGHRPASPARSRRTGPRSSPGRRGSSTRRRGEYYLHLFSRKQPDLNWENPEVRAELHAMMRWWLDRGVDGFRMDVINVISKDPSLPDGRRRRRRPPRRRHPALPRRPAASTSSCTRCTTRSSPAASPPCSPSARCPGSRSRRRGCSPTRPAARSTWCSSSSTCASTRARRSGTCGPSTSAALKASFGRWQAGLAEVGLEQPLLGQPRPAARRVALRRRRPLPRPVGEDARHRAAPAPRHAVRVPGRRARHDQRAVRATSTTSATSSRSTTTPRPWPPEPTPTDVLDGTADHGPRQRPHADAVGRLGPTPASPPAPRGWPSTRTTSRSTPRRSSPTRTRSSTTTAR